MASKKPTVETNPATAPPPFLTKGGFPGGLMDDCDRPACEDTVTALTATLNRLQKTSNDKSRVDCPPTKESIGASSWALLHTMAAWYPEQPSAQDCRKMQNFFEAIAAFYPCPHCATDFEENLVKSPVRTESRESLCTWLCEQHNLVNEKLGKPLFSCELSKLDERWRKSTNPQCNKSNEDISSQ